MKLLEKHFDLAFAAPDSVQKLRELILTLAMQGKLVPQDPNDQSASNLLKEIAAEKQQLVKEGKIKQPKPSPEIKLEEVPYGLSEGWKWCYLDDICTLITDGTHHTPTYTETGIPFISVKDVSSGVIDFSATRFISEQEHKELTKRCHPERGDVLLTKVGTTGIALSIDTDIQFSIFVSVALLKLIQEFVDTDYVTRLINSPLVRKYSIDGTEGVGNKNLVLRKIKAFLIPLPPLAEQHRIVAKIDRLMVRCDELEKLRGDRNQKRITIHTAALNRLLTAKESSDFSTAWRFITQHFGELYSVKENVAELRKAILQLAIMGKLVPQDLKDEPANELLKAIESEKQQLVEEGKIQQPKPLPKIKLEDTPYQLPKQWEWVRLGTVVISSHAGRSPQCLPRRRMGDEWGVLKVSAVSWGTFNPDENKALPPEMQPRLEDEVKTGDFLLSRANTEELVARSVVVTHAPPNLMISDKTVRLIISAQVDKQFINVSNLSNDARIYYASNASGTSSSMKNVSREIMYQLPIPLPPLAEQNRIIAKIDQLMTLCDQLDQQIDAATSKQTTLLNAVMAQV